MIQAISQSWGFYKDLWQNLHFMKTRKILIFGQSIWLKSQEENRSDLANPVKIGSLKPTAISYQLIFVISLDGTIFVLSSWLKILGSKLEHPIIISRYSPKIQNRLKNRLTPADLNFNEIYHHLIVFYSLNDEQAQVNGFSGFEFNCLITFWPVIEIISDFKEESVLWLYLTLTYPLKVMERLILSWNHSNFNLFLKSFFPRE